MAAGCGQQRPAAGDEAGAKDSAQGSSAAGARALERVSLQLNWFPEAEHGGFYTAKVDKLFEREGLDVAILPGGPESPVAQRVARGDVAFGVSNADNVLFSRSQQAPVVAVMAALQTSPRCIMTHAAAGVRSFHDLKNMTLAMSNSLAFSFYLRSKVPLENVRIVPYGGNVAAFLRDPKLAQQGYVFSEPLVARRQGGDPRILMLADLGFNPYASLLITNEETIRRRPDLVRKMVAASIEGWKRYLEDPTTADRRIHELNPQMDLDVLDEGAAAIKPLALGLSTAAGDDKDAGTRKNDSVAGTASGGPKETDRPSTSDDRRATDARTSADQWSILGRMTLARWQTLADQLVECGQLKRQEADPAGAFTTEFLPTTSP